jgi:hypothetical protein
MLLLASLLFYWLKKEGQRTQSLGAARQAKREAKTYNSGDSLVVTHLTTNPPVSCLDRAERTGSLAFTHATATKVLSISVCGDLNGVAPFPDAAY